MEADALSADSHLSIRPSPTICALRAGSVELSPRCLVELPSQGRDFRKRTVLSVRQSGCCGTTGDLAASWRSVSVHLPSTRVEWLRLPGRVSCGRAHCIIDTAEDASTLSNIKIPTATSSSDLFGNNSASREARIADSISITVVLVRTPT